MYFLYKGFILCSTGGISFINTIFKLDYSIFYFPSFIICDLADLTIGIGNFNGIISSGSSSSSSSGSRSVCTPSICWGGGGSGSDNERSDGDSDVDDGGEDDDDDESAVAGVGDAAGRELAAGLLSLAARQERAKTDPLVELPSDRGGGQGLQENSCGRVQPRRRHRFERVST